MLILQVCSEVEKKFNETFISERCECTLTNKMITRNIISIIAIISLTTNTFTHSLTLARTNTHACILCANRVRFAPNNVCACDRLRALARKNCVFNRGNKSISITCCVHVLEICVSMNFDHNTSESAIS